MASENELLQKEKEYYAINSELERQTAELLKKADMVLKIQQNATSVEVKNIKEDLDNIKFSIPKSGWIKHEDHKGDYNFDGGTKVDIPESVNNMSAKAIHNYFRAKMQTMQNEHDKVLKEYRKQSNEIKNLEKENKNLIEEKEKWFHLSNVHKNTINKLENKILALNAKYQAKENEVANLKRETEQLKAELKTVHLNLNSTEARTTKAITETEKMKTILKTTKQEEKNTMDSYKKQIAELTMTTKQLEKQNNELKQGFKKQLQLVENLKMQKMYLEASKIFHTTNREYMEMLDNDST